MVISSLTELISNFLTSYAELFIGLFSLGVCFLLSRTYSNTFYMFAFTSIALFFIFSNVVFVGTSVASLLIATILKETGM